MQRPGSRLVFFCYGHINSRVLTPNTAAMSSVLFCSMGLAPPVNKHDREAIAKCQQLSNKLLHAFPGFPMKELGDCLVHLAPAGWRTSARRPFAGCRISPPPPSPIAVTGCVRWEGRGWRILKSFGIQYSKMLLVCFILFYFILVGNDNFKARINRATVYKG